jgi:hypothetical protein
VFLSISSRGSDIVGVSVYICSIPGANVKRTEWKMETVSNSGFGDCCACDARFLHRRVCACNTTVKVNEEPDGRAWRRHKGVCMV